MFSFGLCVFGGGVSESFLKLKLKTFWRSPGRFVSNPRSGDVLGNISHRTKWCSSRSWSDRLGILDCSWGTVSLDRVVGQVPVAVLLSCPLMWFWCYCSNAWSWASSSAAGWHWFSVFSLTVVFLRTLVQDAVWGVAVWMSLLVVAAASSKARVQECAGLLRSMPLSSLLLLWFRVARWEALYLQEVDHTRSTLCGFWMP